MRQAATREQAPDMLDKAALYFHTTRYLKPGQILGRVLEHSKKRFGFTSLPEPPVRLKGTLRSAVPFVHHDPWNSAEGLRKGRFRFLNYDADLGWPANWKAPALPLLWQFNLHYFDYLYLLNREDQLEIAADWVHANRLENTVAWRPYPTSLRVVNWCKLQLDTPELLRSIYQQASHLYRNIEFHHPGNHLLENAKALIFAGTYFQGQGEADQWLRKGLRILQRETPVQVLKDGGYFECSPMYHAIMLTGYLDIINILPEEHPHLPLLKESAKRMADFLVSVTHPNGHIALFNDSTHEIAISTRSLAEYVQDLLLYTAKKLPAFQETGYFVHESPSIYLIIDGGAIGPDFLPAHAHADIFSYELSVEGHPFIVDSGVFEYSAGAMRSYVRSTLAHNTISIDEIDQAECWASFRVARRFPPHDVSFTRDETESKFEGRFSGYARLIGDGIVHRRQIICNDGKREIHIEDSISGKGTHMIKSLLHLHPGVSVHAEGNSIFLWAADTRCSIDAHGGTTSIVDGWYCPEFGLKLRNKVVVLGGEYCLPTQLSYTIKY
jgi:uncharacterized heparinase superfamily protein